ncbi:MAG: chromosome segregation protein SMC [Candidatus Altiarchaeota archaeon]|nr:chromosome segregation protein SMC [Candidatus Altiarchaeota archaeon]
MTLPKIKSIKIKGFKSFSHPVTLGFDHGITAVVGPNGSGKSNIIDVLSFVLGSLSFSSMRSKKAKELLYVGKTTRAKNALIELLITDPDKKVSEDGILKVSRKLFGDGTSTYRIADKRTTRLNVLDTLSALNIFSDGHNMVKQGDITKFVRMSSADRKGLIDTIAGIELYERKKTRALTDLNEVEMKIEKVTAVHDERLRIYTNLKGERLNVEKFYELKDLERQAHFGLLLENQARLQERLESKLAEKKQIEERSVTFQKKLSDSKAKLDAFNREMENEGMSRRIEVIQKVESIKFEIEKLKNEKKVSAQDLTALEKRKSSLETQLEGLFNRKKQLESLLQTQGPDIEVLNTQVFALKKQRADLASNMAKNRQEYDLRKKRIEKAQGMRNEFLMRKKEQELEKASHEKFIGGLESELVRLKERKLIAESEKEALFGRKKKAEVTFREVNQQLESDEQDLVNLRVEKERLMSSGMPAGSKKLKAAGFELLGEKVNETALQDVAPFIFGVIASDKDLTKLNAVVEEEKTWAVVIPEGLSVQDLKGRVDGLTVIGKPSKFEFESEVEKQKKVKAFSSKVANYEKKIKAAREAVFKLQAELDTKFNNAVFDEIEARRKEIKTEVGTRKENKGRLDESINALHEKLKSLRVEKLDIPDFSILEDLNNKINLLETKKISLESEIRVNQETLDKLIVPELGKLQNLLQEISVNIKGHSTHSIELDKLLSEVTKKLDKHSIQKDRLETEIRAKLEKKNKFETTTNELTEKIYSEKANLKIAESKITELEISFSEINDRGREFEGVEPIEQPGQVLRRVLNEIEALGELNFRAREDFENVKLLVEKIQTKLEKLSEERDAIVKLMEGIEEQKQEKFMETFNGIGNHFKRIFKTVIQGDAKLEVEKDEEGISGVAISVRLNDRDMSVDALSGGQKTLAALAFIFAIQHFKPSPLYIFDEVEAALDKHNSEKFARMLKDMGKGVQILIVTHNDHTVKVADQIIGVYMHRGVSKIISLPKEKVLSEEKWLGRDEETPIQT